jgi:DNA mismatch endonuclease (patch repair protein)
VVFNTLRGLGAHVNFHGFTAREYYDEYYKKKGEGSCFNCKSITRFRSPSDGYKKFCSKDCANKITWISRKYVYKKMSDAQRSRISETLKEGYRSGRIIHPMLGKIVTVSDETRLKISKKLIGRVFSIDHKKKLKEARRFQVLPFKDTSIEVRLQHTLKKLKIKFRTHEPIIGQPDIFIKPNICLFADGDYWHTLPGRKEYDLSVNRRLRYRGYSVLRFWESDINKKIDKCIRKIERHVLSRFT